MVIEKTTQRCRGSIGRERDARRLELDALTEFGAEPLGALSRATWQGSCCGGVDDVLRKGVVVGRRGCVPYDFAIGEHDDIALYGRSGYCLEKSLVSLLHQDDGVTAMLRDEAAEQIEEVGRRLTKRAHQHPSIAVAPQS